MENPDQPTEPMAPAIEPAATKSAQAEPVAEQPASVPPAAMSPPESPEPKQSDAKQSRLRRLSHWYKNHKKISLPLSLLLILLIAFAIPWSRYQLAGLALKQNISVQVVDSVTGTPVSGATVSSGGISAETDGNGQATLKLKDGWHRVSVTKSYYQSLDSKILAPILRPKAASSLSLVATGRQVGINLTNQISGQALAGADIEAAGVSAKTDSSGNATIVVPAGQATVPATISLSGYNDAKVTLQVSSTEIKQNKFTLVPAGKVYFLSNASGTLDVMSANLDGSGPKVILAGTGNEDSGNTTMLVSPDNKYIALLTKRTTDDNPQIYIISTASGATSLLAHGSANFSLYGWTGDYLIYGVAGFTTNTWQTGRNQLKSYNAANGQTIVLSQSQATGNSNAAADQEYDFVTLTPTSVIYAANWVVDYNLGGTPTLTSQSNTFSSISSDGSSATKIASYPATDQINYSQYAPNYIYIDQYNPKSSTRQDSYFSYQVGGGAPIAVTLTQAEFYKSRPYYYYSPDGKHTFWSEVRDGKNTLLVGDINGANAKAVASLSDFDTYGWYSNDYLLLSKSNELYITSVNGGTPVKITAYQSSNSPGYEYYGGNSGRGGGGY